MPNAPSERASSEKRVEVFHVDPANPTGPMLTELPDPIKKDKHPDGPPKKPSPPKRR